MSEPTPKAPRPRAARNFRDAGTGRSFKKGDALDVDPAALANYEAAGLMTKPDTDETKAKTTA